MRHWKKLYGMRIAESLFLSFVDDSGLIECLGVHRLNKFWYCTILHSDIRNWCARVIQMLFTSTIPP